MNSLSIKKGLLCLIILLTTISSTNAESYLNGIGGFYDLITNYSQLKDGDIVIIASHSLKEGKDEVRLMTVPSAEHSGMFGYDTNVAYNANDGMPQTIQADVVNTEEGAHEYVVLYKSTPKNNYLEIYLQDIDGFYLKANADNKQIALEKATYAWRTFDYQDNNNQYVRLLTNSQYSIVCDNYQSPYDYDNGYFYIRNSTTNLNWANIYRKTHKLHIGSTGYATFYYGNNDAILPKGVKAYTYRLDDEKIVPSHVFDGDTDDNIIPYNTAVILSADKNTTVTLDIKNSQTFNVYPNLLRGTDINASTQQEGEVNCKYLALGNGVNGVGFYYANKDGAPFINGAHKAYLCLDGVAAARVSAFIMPDGNQIPTGIFPAAVTGKNETTNSIKCYDMIGRPANTTGRGVIIKQGKAILQ